jgi:hypothetical protein
MSFVTFHLETIFQVTWDNDQRWRPNKSLRFSMFWWLTESVSTSWSFQSFYK